LERLTLEERAAFEDRVRGVAEAEGITSPLDMGLVRDFVFADILEENARVWLMRRGFILGEVERTIGDVQVLDANGVPIIEAAIPSGVIDALKRVIAWKHRAHERLRAGTGERGDASRLTVAEDARRELRKIFDMGGDA